MSKTIKPLKDKVLVELRDDLDGVKDSGILIPESVWKPKNKGVIIALGPKVDSKNLAKGDVILVSDFGGIEVHDGSSKRLKIFAEKELIAKF